jgi:GAF domain-containing protein
MNENIIPDQPNTKQSVEVSHLNDLRENLLTWLMGLILVIGTVIAGLNTRQLIEDQNFLFVGVAWVTVIYLGLIFGLGYFGKVSYLLRAISSISLTYIIAVLSFDNYGLVGDGRPWLILFVVLSTAMLGLRASIATNIISVITYIIVGYMTIQGIIDVKVDVGMDYTNDPFSWVTAGVTMVFVNALLSVAVTALLRGLDRSLSELGDSLSDSTMLSENLELERGRLARRSHSLEHRLVQIRNAAEIIKTMGAILDPEELVQQVANLVQERFELYYVGVFTVDDRRRYAELSAGSGEAGRNMVAERHQLAVGGSSMVGWATAHGEPRISLNVDQESVRFKNPHLPDTRSELALPISIANTTIGALSVQSTSPDAFDDDDITVLQSISDSLGIAIENARLFQQFEQSLGEIQQLNRRYLAESWGNIWQEEEQTASSESDMDAEEKPAQEMSIPLVLRGDQVIGNISFDTEQTEFTSDDQEFLDAITNQAALALESARLLDEATNRVEQERALRNLTTRFSQTLDFDTLLQSIVKEIGQMPLIKEASIHVTPPDNIPSNQNGDSQQSDSPAASTTNDLDPNQ